MRFAFTEILPDPGPSPEERQFRKDMFEALKKLLTTGVWLARGSFTEDTMVGGFGVCNRTFQLWMNGNAKMMTVEFPKGSETIAQVIDRLWEGLKEVVA